MQYTKRVITKMALISCCTAFSLKKNVFMSEQPLLSEILRGEYENKIRRYSPPEKIFDVFATIRQDGELYMNLHDLLKAICFYNFSTSDQKQTQNFEPKAIVELMGKKQKFQIYDYFILVRFLAYQRKKIEKYFEDNIEDFMDKTAFRKYLLESVCQDYNQFIKPPIALESRQFKPSQKKFEQSINQTVQSVFKHHSKGLSLNSLVDFRKRMIRELFAFQYLMFKHDENNLIDGTDFARSIIKYVESSKKRKYMKRIKEHNPQFQKTKIGMNAYIGFHFYIQTNIEELVRELNTHGAVNADEVYHLINKYVAEERHVSKEQTDILIKVLDIDDSGFIQKKQFLGVLQNLQYYTQVKSGQQTFTQMMQQDWVKMKNKFKRIIQILEE